MKPLPHYFGGERVLAIDFVREQVLLAVGHESSPHMHARLRFDHRARLVREVPHRGAQVQRPALHDDDAWRFGADVRDRIVHYHAAYASIESNDARKMLEHVVKLAGKSHGLDALVRVEISADGVHLESLGEGARVSSTFAVPDQHPAPRDGLGVRVVLASALLSMLKDHYAGKRVWVSALHRAGTLRVGVHVLWSANAGPVQRRAPRIPLSSVPCTFAPALARALVYASTDEARPILHQVLVQFVDAEVKLTATDGHSLYREVHDETFKDGSTLAAILRNSTALSIPPAVAKRLTKGKSKHLNISRGSGTWHITRDGCTFMLPVDAPAFPPAEQLLCQQSGKASTPLAAKDWEPLRDYASKCYRAKAAGQDALLRFGASSIEMAVRSKYVKKKGKKTETSYEYTEAKTFGADVEPSEPTTSLEVSYLYNALFAMPEGEDLLIYHGHKDNDPVFFVSSGRTCLVSPKLY